ncbi:hypothetical protein ACFY7C_19505 [Streptomyces sp. NPDC012769]|uniref:hypothetical protein n=1 Tax=Streptomyces sp. NPDC012769 TaxID=3364848 RepID=UPI003677DCF1
MTLESLIQEAVKRVASFELATAEYSEGSHEYDSVLSDYEADAWYFVQRVAELRRASQEGDE